MRCFNFTCVSYLTVVWKSPVQCSFTCCKQEKSKGRRKTTTTNNNKILAAHVTYLRLNICYAKVQTQKHHGEDNDDDDDDEMKLKERKKQITWMLSSFFFIKNHRYGFVLLCESFFSLSWRKKSLMWNWLCLLNGLNRWEGINFARSSYLFVLRAHTHSQSHTHTHSHVHI